MIYFVVVLFLFLRFLFYVRDYLQLQKAFGHLPTVPLQILSPLNVLHQIFRLPSWLSYLQGPTLSEDAALYYDKLNTNLLCFGTPVERKILVRDAQIVKDICSNPKLFEKPIDQYEVLNFWGPNLLTTNGEVWRRHRMHCNSGFSEQNTRVVARVTVEKMNEIFTSLGDSIDPDQIPLDVALSVISEAAFGQKLFLDRRRDCEFVTTKNHIMPFTESIYGVSKYLLIHLAIPKIFNVFPRVRKIRDYFREFGLYMDEILQGGKKSMDENKKDIINLLIRAGSQGGVSGLMDQEIISDTFILLLAGHETTAHSLSFAIRLLALHVDVQEELHQKTMEILGDRDPTYEDLPKLEFVTKVIQETLRLFPAVIAIPKQNTKPVNLGPYSIPTKSTIYLDTYNLHRSPEYWTDPEKFDPHRWDKERNEVGVMNPHCWIPFSYGQRSCIGRKFAEVEATLFLTKLAQNYYWRNENNYSEEHLLKWTSVITTTPVNSVKFKVYKR
eukprot:TRINITY_DN11566_c0_g1_i1.p1 TRINITY_DN11566_c0_g1~~TRINITY_DN11566_c0_g1_i1.p1  ORF type:complete len:498 (-),score=92.04 TRINITY_DN11566_c0_g1_i1:29-1522(-)